MMKKTYAFAMLAAIAITGLGCDGGVVGSSASPSSEPQVSNSSSPNISSALAMSSTPLLSSEAASSSESAAASSQGGGIIFPTEPETTTSPTIEAEAHENQALFAPFEIQSADGRTFIVAEGARNDETTDTTPGQAHYTITASSNTIALYAMLNLRDETTDSFFIKIDGLGDEWLMENSRITNGFEELLLGTWTNAEPGETYTVRLLRRETGAQIDSLRVEGAEFGIKAEPINPFLMGKQLYETEAKGCVGCHGINGDGVGANFEGLVDCNFCNNITQLASKIEEDMPPVGFEACDADCAAYIAYYVMEQFNPDEPIGDVEPTKARVWLLTAKEYQATLTQLLGLPSSYVWQEGFEDIDHFDAYHTKADELQVSQKLALYFLEQSEAIVSELNAAQINAISPCTVTQQGCITQFTRSFAQRAFRRDLTNTEADRYLVFAEDHTGENQFRQVMIGILNSPYFLYRTEMGATPNVAEGNTVKLTGFEIANLIAYALTGEPPSEQLMQAARNGELNSPSSLRLIVNEMIASPKVTERLHSFIRAWLLIDEGSWAEVERSDAACNNFAGAKNALEGELTQFLNDNATINSSLTGLLTASFREPTGALRDFYASNNDPDGLGPVRQGIFNAGAFAARHAQFSLPSPVQRGAILRERVLCQDLPELGVAPPQLPEAGSAPNLITNRDLFEVHLEASGTCVGCHEYMDPLGFTMEHLDACGRFRSVDNGGDVDTSGEIIATAFDTPVSGLTELSTVFAQQETVRSCFAANAYQFYRGVTEEETPEPLIKLIADSLDANDSLREILVQMLTHESILIRQR